VKALERLEVKKANKFEANFSKLRGEAQTKFGRAIKKM